MARRGASLRSGRRSRRHGCGTRTWWRCTRGATSTSPRYSRWTATTTISGGPRSPPRRRRCCPRVWPGGPIRTRDVAVRKVVIWDRPVHHLVEQSRHAQLVVTGSRGRGGFTALMLGSTSRALLRASHCPLMIVRS
ncbi:universal stress protein [Rhodococcus sp. T7]|uniref:universal stress protein n=1 Tax=Rhodococcus sp. T7 TaxID=627444 RepID=UPI002E2B48CE|nr:universal stress protein [Rhodococcus sp. T7]